MNEVYIPINKIISELLIQNGIENKVTISYGNIIGCPEEIAIFRKKLGWYYYISDDKNQGYYKGPYDLNALIVLVTFIFPLSKDVHDFIRNKYRSFKMDNFEYVDYKLYTSEQEIDAFEAKYPEKKVE